MFNRGGEEVTRKRLTAFPHLNLPQSLLCAKLIVRGTTISSVGKPRSARLLPLAVANAKHEGRIAKVEVRA